MPCGRGRDVDLLVAWQQVPPDQEISETHHRLLRFQNRHYLSLNGLTGHFDILFCDVDIDLGTDTEFTLEVNAGLDGEGNAGDEAARIAGFEVIDIDAVAVHFFANGVPGP